ncbi:MAG TPA: hypothetical protein DF613_07945 [Lachnospiraceae bacterium]|nr:hypothetical protein [Lachnospiraceae bacterium]
MIPITDRHLWEACGLAIEQDIAELETQPCSHRFSDAFRDSIRQMQKQTGKKHTIKKTDGRTRPLWRFLPVAAVIALVCLAGYRLLALAPFRMGSSGSDYGQSSEAAGQEAGAIAEDTEEYTMETDTAEPAEGAADGRDEVPGGTMDTDDSGNADEYTEKATEEAVNDEAGEEAELASAEKQTTESANASSAKKDSHAENKENSELLLLSVAYHSSSQILELEIRNDSARTIILGNSWMLFDADGETVNIEITDPSRPSRLAPDQTATIRCTLPDGELPEGEYTLDLDDGENILTFSLP